MKNARMFPLFLVALFCLAATPAPQPATLAPDNFDFKALLGEPPADGSAEQKQEIETLLDLQAHRTPGEAKRAVAEESQTLFEFAAPILGEWFTAKNVPLTGDLFKKVGAQGKVIANVAKLSIQRPRPYTKDDRIKPCLELEKTFSFPSGHATRGMLWATLLGEMFPEHRDELLAHGKQFGTDRVLGGVHYPSDVVAGQKLGAEIAKRYLADAEFHAKLEKAKEECLAAAHK